MTLERPWYFTALLTFSAWLAGLTFHAAIVATLEAFQLSFNGLSVIIMGGFFWALMLFTTQKVKAYFFQELTITIALGGAFVLFFGLNDKWGIETALITSIAIGLFHCRITSHFISRFLLILDVYALSLIWMDDQPIAWVNELFVVISLAFAFFLNIRPPAGICVTAWPSALFTGVFFSSLYLFEVNDFHAVFIAGTVFLLVTLLYIFRSSLNIRNTALLSGATLLLLAIASPGTVIALSLILLGWMKGDMRYAILGLAYSIIAIINSYITLDTDLLSKAGVAAGVGFGCLGIWSLMKYGEVRADEA